MQNQGDQTPSATKTFLIQNSLLASFGRMMRMLGVDEDSDAAKQLYEAMILNIQCRMGQQDTRGKDQGPPPPAAQTPRSEFRPDESIWGPLDNNSSITSGYRNVSGESTQQSSFRSISGSSYHNTSIDEGMSNVRLASRSLRGHVPSVSSAAPGSTRPAQSPRASQRSLTHSGHTPSWNDEAEESPFSQSWSHGGWNTGHHGREGYTQVGLHIVPPSAANTNVIQLTPPPGLGTVGEQGPRPRGTSQFPPGLPLSGFPGNSNGAEQRFRPMQAVLEPFRQDHAHSRSLNPTIPIHSPFVAPQALKFSDKYFGMHTEVNASAEHLPDNQNCALWLRNLPPDINYRELLASIHNIGRIWCTFINTPDFVAHTTAAAKVVFFAPESARLFLQHVDAIAPCIRGFRIKAGHNRIKYPRHSTSGGASRVLIVTGEAWFVNETSLMAWFSDKFVFQVDEVIELVRAGGRAVVEFRFGSYRCQSQMGKMSLDRNRPPGFKKAEYGDDPCEKGDSLVSYRIAAQRIQSNGI